MTNDVTAGSHWEQSQNEREIDWIFIFQLPLLVGEASEPWSRSDIPSCLILEFRGEAKDVAPLASLM